MPASLLLVLFSPLLAAASEPHNSPPFYATDSITNSADYLTALAPNAIGTIFGTGLSYTTASLSAQDIVGGVMPYGLPGSGVNVLIGGLAANLFYVSPTQINFLAPSILIAGPTHIQVVLNGIAGPSVPFTLTATSPALYQLDPKTVIATRLDGSLITAAAPAQPGEILSLWATGLGDTIPPVIYSNVATTAATLQLLSEFKVLLNGTPVDSSLILYAGVAPGYAGLYQINVQLPSAVSSNPDLQIGLGDAFSPAGLILPLLAPSQ